jgi:hypothetical protein
MVALITLNILGIPEGADSIRDWIVWTAAIIGGLVAIGVGVYKIAVWLKGALAAAGFDLLEPKFDELERKIDSLRADNEDQHSANAAANAAAVAMLSAELHADREAFGEHLKDAALATEQLRIVAAAVETHIGLLRDEITSPGLPVTPGPLAPPGPPHTRRMMF